MVDENVRGDVERIKVTVLEQLRQLESAPGASWSNHPSSAASSLGAFALYLPCDHCLLRVQFATASRHRSYNMS